MRPAPKSTRSGGRLSHHQWLSTEPSASALRVPASGARNGQLARAGAPITTAQVATAMRQPSALAMGGSVRAEITPPTVRPICLMPMAMPRSWIGKRSTMALPRTGLTTLQPTPARKRQPRNIQKRGAAQARASPSAPRVSPPRRVGRTPQRSARCPAGREKRRPPRYTHGTMKATSRRESRNPSTRLGAKGETPSMPKAPIP